jgi:tetratricopeptide (TPR) repeat protein
MPNRVARRDGPRRGAVLTLLAAAALARAAVADPPDPKSAPPSEATPAPAPAPKSLSGDDARKVAELRKAIDDLWRAGKFAEALGPARQAAAVCEQALGRDHWQTADARRRVETLDKIAGLPEEGRQALAAVRALDQEFREAYGKERYADAERLARQLVEVQRHWLGEAHSDTADSYSFLAIDLWSQGKLAEAEALLRKALAINLKARGEGHPNTGSSYNNLAVVLYD